MALYSSFFFPFSLLLLLCPLFFLSGTLGGCLGTMVSVWTPPAVVDAVVKQRADQVLPSDAQNPPKKRGENQFGRRCPGACWLWRHLLILLLLLCFVACFIFEVCFCIGSGGDGGGMDGCHIGSRQKRSKQEVDHPCGNSPTVVVGAFGTQHGIGCCPRPWSGGVSSALLFAGCLSVCFGLFNVFVVQSCFTL